MSEFKQSNTLRINTLTKYAMELMKGENGSKLLKNIIFLI